MKFKTTTKAIREGSWNLRCADYCDLSYLLRGMNRLRIPAAFTAGIMTCMKSTA